jgi:hypothetical protein
MGLAVKCPDFKMTVPAFPKDELPTHKMPWVQAWVNTRSKSKISIPRSIGAREYKYRRRLFSCDHIQ